jgi:hypothetical protein
MGRLSQNGAIRESGAAEQMDRRLLAVGLKLAADQTGIS